MILKLLKWHFKAPVYLKRILKFSTGILVTDPDPAKVPDPDPQHCWEMFPKVWNFYSYTCDL
jgi:hypothetical protein